MADYALGLRGGYLKMPESVTNYQPAGSITPADVGINALKSFGTKGLSGLLSNPAIPIIGTLLEVGSNIIGSAIQAKAMREAAAKEEKMYQDEQLQNRRAIGRMEQRENAALGLQRESLEETKRQNARDYQMKQSDTAYNRLKDQFQQFSENLSRNEQLKGLFLNRLGGLK